MLEFFKVMPRSRKLAWMWLVFVVVFFAGIAPIFVAALAAAYITVVSLYIVLGRPGAKNTINGRRAEDK